MNLKKQQGFTLIELMIVVAIIAILAAIALPAYQDYVIRTQVSEGAVLADGAKTAVAEYYSNTGNPPADNAAAGLAPAGDITGKYVDSVTVAGGVISSHFGGARVNAAISGNNLIFTPVFSTTAGSVVWTCSADAAIKDKWLATICRTGQN